jgi:hypothetical protein
MQRMTFSAILGLSAWIVGPVNLGDLDGFAVNGRHWIQQDEVYLNNGMGFFGTAKLTA